MNFKRLVLALLKNYRYHLLRDERNRLGAAFGMVWGWLRLVLGWFQDGFVVVLYESSSFIKDPLKPDVSRKTQDIIRSLKA